MKQEDDEATKQEEDNWLGWLLAPLGCLIAGPLVGLIVLGLFICVPLFFFAPVVLCEIGVRSGLEWWVVPAGLMLLMFVMSRKAMKDGGDK